MNVSPVPAKAPFLAPSALPQDLPRAARLSASKFNSYSEYVGRVQMPDNGGTAELWSMREEQKLAGKSFLAAVAAARDAAKLLTGDLSKTVTHTMAVMQSKSGWYTIAPAFASYHEIPYSGIDLAANPAVKQQMGFKRSHDSIAALVGATDWVNFEAK